MADVGGSRKEGNEVSLGAWDCCEVLPGSPGMLPSSQAGLSALGSQRLCRWTGVLGEDCVAKLQNKKSGCKQVEPATHVFI